MGTSRLHMVSNDILLSLSPIVNPSYLRKSKLSFFFKAICLLEQGLKGGKEGVGVSTGGGRLEASCRALVRRSLGTLGARFLLARVSIENWNETLGIEL